MQIRLKHQLYLFISLIFMTCSLSAKPIVIAHRGASGYLPEHTLASKALAYALHPDYIEQDVVATRDGHLIVLHDHHLDQVTDVAERFPHRHRHDGRYYAIDFDLAEIKQLQVSERFNRMTGKAIFPNRFQQKSSTFQVSTLEEEIQLIQGLNQTLHYDVGLYVEVKSPSFHRNEGLDISQAVLSTLKNYGYHTKEDRIYLQCFDANELMRITQDLMPNMDMNLKAIQLLYYDDPQHFQTPDLNLIQSYADGIGINQEYLDTRIFPSQSKAMIQQAHSYAMQVHVYTHRVDAPHRKDLNQEQWMDYMIHTLSIDGVFTDFVDVMNNLLH